MIQVGLDVGATRTRLAAGSDPTRPLRMEGPGAAIRPGSEAESARVVADMIREILRSVQESVGWIVVGSAGAGREPSRDAFGQELESLISGARLHVTTDIETALEDAWPDSPGVLLAAGTGSYAAVRLPDGRSVRVGGLGWRLGDEGSSYRLGVLGLREAGRALDGRIDQTGITRAILEHVGYRGMDELVDWAHRAGIAEIAALARAVCRESDRGDAVAQRLVRQSAGELAELVRAARERVASDNVTVKLTGSLIEHDTPVRRELLRALDEIPGLTHEDAAVDGARGALRMAIRLSRHS